MIGAFVLVCLGLLPCALWALVQAAEHAQRRDKWIRPAAQVLIDNLPKTGTDAVGVAANIAAALRTHPERYVTLPKVWPIDPTDLTSHVLVKLPISPGTNEKVKDRIAGEIGSRLGFDGAPSAEWLYVGHGALVKLYPTPSFGAPRTVYDYLPFVEAEAGSPHRVVLGTDVSGAPVVYDHVTMGPHIKASAGSGGGKSNLYRFLVPQYIRSGAQVVILDVKGVSMLDLAVALEFRNIKYYSEAETCHNAFQAVFAELERRRKEDISARLSGRAAVFAPLHVIMEEANTLMAMLKDFWEYAKAAHSEAARHSPAVRSMHYSVYMGREFGIYIHVICQRAEAAVFGGGAVRENFNAALMSKWDMRTWKMLAHGHRYIPHPMDWSWYLVTSTAVVRYMPPHLQESDACLLADLDNVSDLAWSAELEAVPDVRVTSVQGYLPQGVNEIAGLPHIELAMTVTLKEAHSMLAKHGHNVPLTVLEQWQKGARSAESKGYAPWPSAVGANGRTKVYARTDILAWLTSGPEPSGKFWDGVFVDIRRADLAIKPHVIYGLRVETYGDTVGYIGQTHQALETRSEQHAETQYWGDLITDTVEIFSGDMTCIEAREIEGLLTDTLACVLNRPVPQVGADVRPRWNPAAETVEGLRDARHARDIESGRPLFSSPMDRSRGVSGRG